MDPWGALAISRPMNKAGPRLEVCVGRPADSSRTGGSKMRVFPSGDMGVPRFNTDRVTQQLLKAYAIPYAVQGPAPPLGAFLLQLMLPASGR
jgi:hypothetical protein